MHPSNNVQQDNPFQKQEAMALNIPPQKSFLYKSNWTHALDESLLESIIRLKHEHDMTGTVVL